MSFVHAQPKQPQLHGVGVIGVDAAFPAFVEVVNVLSVPDIGEMLAVFDSELDIDVEDIDAISEIAGLVVVAGAPTGIDGVDETGKASRAATTEEDWEDEIALGVRGIEADEEDKGAGAGEEADGFESVMEGIEGILEVLDVAFEGFEKIAEEPERDVEWLRWGSSTSQDLLLPYQGKLWISPRSVTGSFMPTLIHKVNCKHGWQNYNHEEDHE